MAISTEQSLEQDTDRFGVGMYSPRVAARIASIRYQSFQAWSKAHLLRPTKIGIGKREESSYSYHDLLMIRLIVRLKGRGFRPKQIRGDLETIANMSGGDPHAWLRATIYVASGLIVAVVPGREDWRPVAASKGPQKMALVFFPELVEELKKELVPDRFMLIDLDPEIVGGAPVIKGTRIPTTAVSSARRSGQDPTSVYPELSPDQVTQAEEYESFLDAA